MSRLSDARPSLARRAPLFISHGAPNLGLHDTPAREFLRALGDEVGAPGAILVASAHFLAPGPALTADASPRTVHDFGGFEPELREIRYRAPGAPERAADIAARLRKAGFDARLAHDHGFDHGTWVPLTLMRPQADIPVIQMSVDPARGPGWHLALGRALAPLVAEDVLIVGSGAATHNLAEMFGGRHGLHDPAPGWVSAFGEWLAQTTARGDVAALLDYERRAPYGRENHPTPEHILPFFVALGAAGEGAAGTRIHSSGQYGVLMTDVYGFGRPEAASIAA